MNLFARVSENGSVTSDEFIPTTEAAELCRVTRFTIRNWILENKLKASQTAGGHHRIRRADLLKFMKDVGIQPATASPKSKAFLHCWEYLNLTSADSEKCKSCLVFKEQANRCFLTVRQFGPEKVSCCKDCSECEYMAAYFPEEQVVWKKMRDRESQKVLEVQQSAKRKVSSDENAFAEGIYKSGKYVAALKSIFVSGSKKRKFLF